MTRSISSRLLIFASLIMAAFFGVTGFVLDRAHYQDAESTLQDRLQVQAYMLVAASEISADGAMRVVHPVPEVRFFLPDSGLYARIVRNDGMHKWDSPSIGPREIPFPTGFERTAGRFDYLQLVDGTELYAYSVGVAWGVADPFSRTFTVNVAEGMGSFNNQIALFRRTLWAWLSIIAASLLVIQWAVLRWGLEPLRRVAADLGAIEAGRKSQLDEGYPSELKGLTTNLNTLVRNEREQRERSRRALGDLAHSLKTPLTILRGAAEGRSDINDFRDTVEDQIDRMSEIVDYQLRRAATAGRVALKAAVPVAAVSRKVVATLDKAYAYKQVECRVKVGEDVKFHGDEDDLIEVLGNLLDNAYKWCRHVVQIEARAAGTRHEAGNVINRITICIEDDGSGVSEAISAAIFERGIRADESREGHGIGLAVVRDIVEVYGGHVTIGRGGWGGAKVTVEI